MYQHQHAPLPLERLKDVPQPGVVLLEKLLEKDPAQRYRTPSELLKAIPTITGAIDARRRITRQSLQKTPSAVSRVGTRKPLARLAPKKIAAPKLNRAQVGGGLQASMALRATEREHIVIRHISVVFLENGRSAKSFARQQRR
jgi:hypothetical protein